MEQQYNTKCPAVKRLMREARELREPTHQYFAQPLEDNLFDWHFTVAGTTDSAFHGGRYHGRIILPPEYPMKPPHIILFTHNGRFSVGQKICLSASGHHPETWQPSWSIRTVLLALIGFMPTEGQGAIGALDYTDAERIRLAKKSVDYVCPTCGVRAGSVLKEGDAASNEDEKAPVELSFKGAKASSQSAGKQEDNASAPNGSPAAAASDEPPEDAAAMGAAATGSSSDTVAQAQIRQRLQRERLPKVTIQRNLPPAAVEFTDWRWATIVLVLVAALVFLAVRRAFFL